MRVFFPKSLGTGENVHLRQNKPFLHWTYRRGLYCGGVNGNNAHPIAYSGKEWVEGSGDVDSCKYTIMADPDPIIELTILGCLVYNKRMKR